MIIAVSRIWCGNQSIDIKDLFLSPELKRCEKYVYSYSP